MPESKQNRPYWWKIFCNTLSETGKIAALSGAGGAMIGVAFAMVFGFAKQDEIQKTVFIIVVSAIGGVLLEFIFRFFFMPPKKAKELEKKIEMLKSQLSPPLSAAAIELLIEAANAGGSITYVEGFGGNSISVNKREFIEPKNPRSSAIWKSALDELVTDNYAEESGYFRLLTAKGYMEADRLKTLENKGENE